MRIVMKCNKYCKYNLAVSPTLPPLSAHFCCSECGFQALSTSRLDLHQAMKTLKPASCSSVVIAIANRSHMRHTSSQARQLDPLREARGRLRGSRPPGGCNACPLKRGAVLGSPGRGWRRSAIPSFFAFFHIFPGTRSPARSPQACKKPGCGSPRTARALSSI